MRHLVSTISALALTATALYTGAGAASALPDERAKKATEFAFKGAGYGTKVTGGEVTAGSETTAYQAMGCNNLAGIERRNFVASEELPGAGTAEEVTTRIWTTQKNGVTTTRTRSNVARVVLAENGLGELALTAVNSLARAWHDDKGFQADSVTTIGGLTFTPTGGEPQVLELPTPDQPVEVPGVATIAIGGERLKQTSDKAKAITDGVVIDIVPTDTTVKIAHARAELERGIKSGLFRGSSYAASASALDGLVNVGRNPLALMPCRGTEGKTLAKSNALADLGGGVIARGLSTLQLGEQTEGKSSGFERGRVAEVNLAEGAINVTGIVGRVNVKRLADGTVKRNTNGTQIGTVTIDGEVQEFPDNDTLEIPGVAKLERAVTRTWKDGARVIALRITLLDGSGAVINLGAANLRIGRASE